MFDTLLYYFILKFKKLNTIHTLHRLKINITLHYILCFIYSQLIIMLI